MFAANFGWLSKWQKQSLETRSESKHQPVWTLSALSDGMDTVTLPVVDPSCCSYPAERVSSLHLELSVFWILVHGKG